MPKPLLPNFDAALILSSISLSYVIPVEIIIGNLFRATSCISGILVAKPDEIFTRGKLIFMILFKLLKSPGVEKKNYSKFFRNFF